MPTETRIVAPSPTKRLVYAAEGGMLEVPVGWELLAPGDGVLTRRVKAGGPSWTVQEKKRRRTFSHGVWAPADRIAEVKAALETERSTEAYKKRRKADAKRRDQKQAVYVEDFHGAVVRFLGFAERHAEVAGRLADAVAHHATPIGSGTVARTERIPIEDRAQAAVIAWLRHATTAYDHMSIARVKGERREVRRKLAERSRRLLEGYRVGDDVDAEKCPLQRALQLT